jgi:hypothetical protein
MLEIKLGRVLYRHYRFIWAELRRETLDESCLTGTGFSCHHHRRQSTSRETRQILDYQGRRYLKFYKII